MRVACSLDRSRPVTVLQGAWASNDHNCRLSAVPIEPQLRRITRTRSDRRGKFVPLRQRSDLSAIRAAQQDFTTARGLGVIRVFY